MSLRSALLTVLLGATAAISAAESVPPKRPITHEDLWLMQRVGAPVLSPDGRVAVVAVVEPAYDPKEQVSDLWLVTVDGSSAPRRLTHTRGAESGVSFSSDSQKILFSAKREGDTEEQVYCLDLAHGGEAERLTDAPLGARAARFSPDGQSIAYVTDTWPGARDDADNRRLAKERSDRKANVRIYDSFPVRSWDHWLDERRPHLMLQSARAGAPARDLLAGSTLASSPGFTGRAEDDGESLEPVWAPDGRGLVFVAGTDRNQAARAFTHLQLWYVSLGGGEPTALTYGPDSYTHPQFGVTGDRLYAEHQRATGHVYELTSVAVLPFHGNSPGTPDDLTRSLDRSVSTWGVGADGAVYFLAEDAGHEHVYVASAGGAIRLLVASPTGAYTGLSVAAVGRKTILVARHESAVQPPEVVRIDPAQESVPLSRFNAARIDALDWSPVEEFSFTAHNGRSIHSLLVKPPGFDPAKQYPLLVLLHGGPHGSWRDQFVLRWNYHLLAAGGYVVLLSDYSGSTGYGEAFAQSIERDPLAGPAQEVNEAADEAIRRYSFIDGKRQCAAGASYGGHLANWLEGSADRYRCLVSHAGLADLEMQWGTSDSAYHREVMIGSPPWLADPLWHDQSPVSHADRFHTPILLSVGERDFRVPLNNTLEMWTALQRQQVESRLLVFPDANHWILKGEDSRLWYAEVAHWLSRYLTPGAVQQ
jgi:dipeptidyl aminopeptidase/acylaminoacyl peptidase